MIEEEQNSQEDSSSKKSSKDQRSKQMMNSNISPAIKSSANDPSFKLMPNMRTTEKFEEVTAQLVNESEITNTLTKSQDPVRMNTISGFQNGLQKVGRLLIPEEEDIFNRSLLRDPNTMFPSK